jgi:biofilm PGA synthesis N-glycosyltransferase PgaC
LRHRLYRYPRVTILIAAYNEAAAIAETIHSVAKQEYPGDLEVLVIDDGSRDDTAAIVEAIHYPSLKLLRQPRNAGKAAALNRGLAAARHDLVITLDADCYLYKRALRKLVGALYERSGGHKSGGRSGARSQIRARTGSPRSRSGTISTASPQSSVRNRSSRHPGCPGAFSIYDRATLMEVGAGPNA